MKTILSKLFTKKINPGMEVTDMKVLVEKKDVICTVIINRPESRNAVDRETATQLVQAFEDFERESSLLAAVLYGEGGNFCAGATVSLSSMAARNDSPD
jgi:enoyl-CoA hydratase